MADKITTTKILAVGIQFANAEKTTGKEMIYSKTENPRENLTEQQIKNVYEPLIKPDTDGNALFTNPHTDEPFDTATTVVKTAYTEEVKTVQLDLN